MELSLCMCFSYFCILKRIVWRKRFSINIVILYQVWKRKWWYRISIVRGNVLSPINYVNWIEFPHSCICLRFIYSHDRSTYFPACSRIGRPVVGYINRSPKHECRNWEHGRAVSFMGIFVSNILAQSTYI